MSLERLSAILTEALTITETLKAPTPSGITRIPNVRHEYTMDPWNLTGEGLLLFHSEGRVALHYGGDGRFYQYLSGVNHSSRPSWSRLRPTVFYYLAENRLMAFDVANNGVTIIREFTEYVRIDSRGETDISSDGDHFVICGTLPDGNEEVFVYSLTNGKVGVWRQYDAFDGLKITAGNRAILSRRDGLWALGPGQQLTNANGHAAVARYQGRDVLLWCNSNEKPVTLSDYPNALVRIDIETEKQTGLLSFPWDYAMHFSACDQEFCLASVYTETGKLPAQIWKVPLDGSKAKMIQDLGNSPVDDYVKQPKAALSHDGSRYIYDWQGDSYIGRMA